MTEWVDAKVTGKIAWTNTLFSLQFEASVDVFEAGQFVTAAIYKMALTFPALTLTLILQIKPH